MEKNAETFENTPRTNRNSFSVIAVDVSRQSNHQHLKIHQSHATSTAIYLGCSYKNSLVESDFIFIQEL